MTPPRPAVVDANRLLGPIPVDDVVSADAVGLLGELDRLRIDAAHVTHTLSLYADPAAGNEALFAQTHGLARLRPVPVVVPGVPGAATPDRPRVLADWHESGVRMVRLCPVRHRFDLTDPLTGDWLSTLEQLRLPVALALDETTPAALRSLAAAHPRLPVLLLEPGYRRLRELAGLLRAAPSIRVETGTLIAQRGVEWLAGQCGADRLVFGTGAPLWDDCGPRFQLDHLDLPEADIARIAAGSLESLSGGAS